MCTMTFDFQPMADMSEIAGTLQLSCIAVESLFGAVRTQVQASYQFRPGEQRLVIDMTDRPGQMLALIFLGYVNKEFGVGVLRRLERKGAV